MGASPTSEAGFTLSARSFLWSTFSSSAFRSLVEVVTGIVWLARPSDESGERIRPQMGGPERLDPAFRRVMTFLFLGTKGGGNRIRIVRLLRQEALNANKIGERLDLDYKTIKHHLEILEEHKVVVLSSPKGTYGTIYFLSQYFEKQLDMLEEMWVKFGRK
jgi:DNA-binding transcriptional ArsR family regulator